MGLSTPRCCVLRRLEPQAPPPVFAFLANDLCRCRESAGFWWVGHPPTSALPHHGARAEKCRPLYQVHGSAREKCRPLYQLRRSACEKCRPLYQVHGSACEKSRPLYQRDAMRAQRISPLYRPCREVRPSVPQFLTPSTRPWYRGRHFSARTRKNGTEGSIPRRRARRDGTGGVISRRGSGQSEKDVWRHCLARGCAARYTRRTWVRSTWV